MRKNIAIVLAGGIGSRLGLSTPKQFFKVAGKMVVEHTIDASKTIRTSMKLPLFPILFILLTLSPSLSRMDGKK